MEEQHQPQISSSQPLSSASAADRASNSAGNGDGGGLLGCFLCCAISWAIVAFFNNVYNVIAFITGVIILVSERTWCPNADAQANGETTPTSLIVTLYTVRLGLSVFGLWLKKASKKRAPRTSQRREEPRRANAEQQPFLQNDQDSAAPPASASSVALTRSTRNTGGGFCLDWHTFSNFSSFFLGVAILYYGHPLLQSVDGLLADDNALSCATRLTPASVFFARLATYMALGWFIFCGIVCFVLLYALCLFCSAIGERDATAARPTAAPAPSSSSTLPSSASLYASVLSSAVSGNFLSMMNPDCSICLDTIENDVGADEFTCIRLLSCNHVFHVVCIRGWIESGNLNRGNCPKCRKIISQSDIVAIRTNFNEMV